MKFNVLRKVSAFCVTALALASVAQAASISGQVGFLGGALGTWSTQFTSSNSSVTLDQLVITLPATYGFDTQSGGFGYLVWADFVKISGGATVNTLTPNSTATRDGATALTVTFNNFDTSASPFVFDIDVDGTASLQPTQNCNALPFLQRAACIVNNATITAANVVAITGASLVDGGEIAGTQISATFTSPFLNTLTLTTTLSKVGDLTAVGTFDGTMVPEPGSYALMGSGLMGLLWLARRRRGR